MSEHLQKISLGEAIEQNKKITFPVKKSNKSRAVGKLRYWWSLFVAAMLLLIIGAPTVILFFIINRKKWLYPFARFGGKWWLKLSGAEVKVTGLENLNPKKNYVFTQA